MTPRFQPGGTLREGSLYVDRPADAELLAALLAGEYCHVLAPRQIGKSSLRVRTARRLQGQGVCCATVDLTRIGGKHSTPEQWYFALLQEVSSRLKLPDDPAHFWQKYRDTTLVHRFVLFLRDVVLARIGQPLVVFLDEIDTILSLPFASDDFFAAVRNAYNARADDPAYQQLSFCLMGVVAPADLIRDEARTPFNIGRGVRLEDFTGAEARAFLPGMLRLGEGPERWLEGVLSWTAGHPYMTQKLCEALIRRVEEGGTVCLKDLDGLVDELFLRRGGSEDGNLEYAHRRFVADPHRVPMLHLYRRLLTGEPVPAIKEDPVQLSLRLCGMAAERQDGVGRQLHVRNRIFATLFDEAWAKTREVERLLAQPLLGWRASDKSDDFVLRGRALEEAQKWARGRADLSSQESEFLLAGLAVARREEEARRQAEREREGRERAEAMARSQRRNVTFLTALAGVLLVLLGTALSLYRKAVHAEGAQRVARHEAEQSVLAERGARAALLSQQPGREIEALAMGIDVVTATLRRHQVPGPLAVEGLTSAFVAARTARPLRGHAGAVWQAAFSPDGERVVTASADGTARLWDTANGQLLSVLDGHSADVMSARFSPDGGQVVTASADGTARLFDGHTGAARGLLRGHTNRLSKALFSPDGRQVLTASDDHTARLWDTVTGAEVRVLPGHKDQVRAAAFSADGGRVLTSSGEEIWIWDAHSGDRQLVLRGHSGTITMASFSPDGKRVLSASRDQTARLWDAEQGRELSTLRGHKDWVAAGLFSPDGRRIVTAGNDNSARVWDGDSGAALLVLQGHTARLWTVAFSADSRRILTASSDRTARVWDTATGGLLLLLPGHSDLVESAVFSPDGRRILTASADHTARIWEPEGKGEPFTLTGHTDSLSAAGFSPDGRRVVTGGADRTARLWDARTARELAVLRGHSGTITSTVFSPDGGRLLTAGNDDTARVWDTSSGRLLLSIKGRAPRIASAGFSPDGTRILGTGRSNSGTRRAATILPDDGTPRHDAESAQTVQVWDAGSGAERLNLRGHEDDVWHASFSPDGRRIVTASQDRTARLWDAVDGRERIILRGHTHAVLMAVFSPDGRRIVTASRDGTARLWDGSSGTGLAILRGHTNFVRTARFSPDGQKVVTASTDGTVRVWDARGGTQLRVLTGHSGEVIGAVFSPDGGRVLSAGSDHTARVFDAQSGQELLCVRGHTGWVNAAVFSPDGGRVLTASNDHTAQIYPATVASFLSLSCQFLRYQPEFAQVRQECLPLLPVPIVSTDSAAPVGPARAPGG